MAAPEHAPSEQIRIEIACGAKPGCWDCTVLLGRRIVSIITGTDS